MTFNAYMHERNIYRNQPDFKQIALDFPEFRKYAIPDAKGQKVRVDFTKTEALRMLTKILLKKDFNLDVEIPEGFLIPTVPLRLNYILWIEDLLSNITPKEKSVSGIDIGTGPCAIFSLLGAQKNGWKFIATESSDVAILWAEKNINKNNLLNNIEVVKVSKGSTLIDVLSTNNESYDFCLCNPPFFESIAEIRSKHRNSNETIADVSQKEEIFVGGGEVDFVRNILKDSLIYKDRIILFTSMFGKKKSLLEIVKEMKEIEDAKFTTTEFYQGNTVRWGIAWTFNESVHFEEKIKKKIKATKARLPLEYQIHLKDCKKEDILDDIIEQATDFLKALEIPNAVTRRSKNFAELLLKSDKDTWSHQRRKRRQLERQKKSADKLEEKNSADSVNEIDSLSNKDCNNDDIPLLVRPGGFSEDKTTGIKSRNDLQQINTEKETEVRGTYNQTVSSEKNISSSDNLFSKSNESSISSETNILHSNKRKGDVLLDDSCINKKARLSEELAGHDPNDCSDKFSENAELRNDNKMEVVPLETNRNTTKDISDSQNYPLEAQRDNVFHSTSDPTSTSEKQGNTVSGKPELSEKTEDTDLEQELVLHCHLQFIRGKKKVYVKMNCPPTADRNTMHQVFQQIKNKIN